MLVNVRDMKVGNSYKVNGQVKKLQDIVMAGAGGSGYTEPYYNLTFDDGTKITKDWDVKFDEVSSGGKRKTRRVRKNKKTRKIHRKSKRYNRH